MKLRLFFSVGIFLFINLAYGQKKILDTSAFNSWQKLEKFGISRDGKYCWYSYGTYINKPLVIQSITGKYKHEFRGGNEAQFSADSKKFLFKTGDTLAILDLYKQSTSYLKEIIDFKTFTNGMSSYLMFINLSKLTIQNLASGVVKEFDAPQSYLLNSQGTKLALKKVTGELQLISIPSFKVKTISKLPQTGNLSFNLTGTALAFTSSMDNKTTINYWNNDYDTAEVVVSDHLPGIEEDYLIADQSLQFSKDGESLFFKVKQVPRPIIKHNDLITTEIVIFGWQEPYLKTEPNLVDAREFFTASYSLAKKKIVQIENKKFVAAPFRLYSNPVFSNDHYVVVQNPVNEDNKFWDSSQKPSYQIFDIKKGTASSFIPVGNVPISEPQISPSERFVVWMNQFDKDIYSFEISTGILHNITSGLKVPMDIVLQGQSLGTGRLKFNRNIMFIERMDKCLLSDRYDIWQLDLSGKQNPLNLTSGYGRRNNIEFNLNIFAGTAVGGSVSFENNGLLKIRLFDWNRGSNGFASIKFNDPKGFQLLCNDPVLYIWGMGGRLVQKADLADIYLLTKETAESSPNLIVSSDLKTFSELTDIHPEKNYNWLSSELIKWPMPSGETGTGILYKPEDFDPSRKYPVLFHYYQKRSDELHRFWEAEPSDGMRRGNSINIPEYVSAGYLVFVPDIINDKPGQIGRTTINTVESAAKYLIKTYPFVDEKRLGLQGHSFGGYETNLIIAGSTMFAAANASSAVSNLVTQHGSLTFGGKETEMFTEIGQPNMGLGISPWNHPQAYIDNSPLFQADKVTTPLLINVGGKDTVVLPSFGYEFFIALRRLKKPVWLLNYFNEDHLNARKAAEDFAIRQRQFFDHYLMGKAAPGWMTQGILSKEEGLKSGFQLEAENNNNN